MEPTKIQKLASEACTLAWQKIADSLTEKFGAQFELEDEMTRLAGDTVLADHAGQTRVLLHFSPAESAESPVAVLMSDTDWIKLSEALSDDDLMDESGQGLSQSGRSLLEIVHQGICQGFSEASGTPFTTIDSEMSISAYSPAIQLQNSEELISSIARFQGPGGMFIVSFISTADLAEVLDQEPEAEAKAPTGHGSGVEILLDIPLSLSVELGRVTMPMQEIVEMGTGSIIEIEKAAGEPVEVLVNGKAVARGEVVVIEDNFGVRITEILDPRDRLLKLKDAA